RKSTAGCSRPLIHRIILFPPRVNPTEQRSNASEAKALKRERDAGAGDFVGAGTIDDDVPVLWKLVAAFLDVVHVDVDGASNNGRILLQFRGRPQIENDGILTRLEFLTQFGHG